MRSLNTSCKHPSMWDPMVSPTTCRFHPSPPRKVKMPKPIHFWGVLPASGLLLTLAEGELRMMAVSTPMAWTAMASELLWKTYGDMGSGGSAEPWG